MNETQSKFTINNIKILSNWKFNIKNSDCTICRCSLNTNSIYKQKNQSESKIVKGVCGHSFHYECIKPWVDKNKYCPICCNNWVYDM
jgi:hypothetical protein